MYTLIKYIDKLHEIKEDKDKIPDIYNDELYNEYKKNRNDISRIYSALYSLSSKASTYSNTSYEDLLDTLEKKQEELLEKIYLYFIKYDKHKNNLKKFERFFTLLNINLITIQNK